MNQRNLSIYSRTYVICHIDHSFRNYSNNSDNDNITINLRTRTVTTMALIVGNSYTAYRNVTKTDHMNGHWETYSEFLLNMIVIFFPVFSSDCMMYDCMHSCTELVLDYISRSITRIRYLSASHMKHAQNEKSVKHILNLRVCFRESFSSHPNQTLILKKLFLHGITDMLVKISSPGVPRDIRQYQDCA